MSQRARDAFFLILGIWIGEFIWNGIFGGIFGEDAIPVTIGALLAAWLLPSQPNRGKQ